MLAIEVIKEVRGILNDRLLPYRWADDDLLGYLGAAQSRIVERRPDAAMSATGAVNLAPATPESTASTLVLGREWLIALTDAVAGRAFMMDAEHAESVARAKMHIDQFNAAIT
jgi:hypothetical protein